MANKRKNGLIELYRFIFALNVVKNHGFFPGNIPYFSPGRISVEFFFILSGFLLLRSLDKIEDMPWYKGVWTVLYKKVKPLFVPLVIGLTGNAVHKILVNEFELFAWGYLWYVQDMLVVCVAYYLLKRLVKSEKAYMGITFGAFLIGALLLSFTPLYSWGIFRAITSISLGMLLSKLPKIKLKRQNLLWIALAPVQIAVFTILMFSLAGKYRSVEIVLDFLLYPALIYLTFQIECKNGFFEYLGSLSFGFYAFHCVTCVPRDLGVTNVWLLFGLICVMVFTENTIKRILQYKKEKRLREETLDKELEKTLENKA